MPKLTAIAVRNRKEPGRMADGGGLSFEITSTGHKRWLYRYRFCGKQAIYTVGHYPALSLAEARLEHQRVKELVARGICPVQQRKKEKLENLEKIKADKESEKNSFEFITLEWINNQTDIWSYNHTVAVLNTFKNDVFRAIGHRQIDTITPPEVLEIIRGIESRGSLEMAKKNLQRISAVFRYAIQTGRAIYNPASEMKGALRAKHTEHMPALYGSDLGKLLRDINKKHSIHIVTKLALQFTALTACRSGEVRLAVWDEVDLKNRLWTIPADRMKMKREHLVPLSKQAMAVLNRAGILFGKYGLIYPSINNNDKPMSDNTMSKALRDLGYRGKATPHGFRSSFSSMAYESSGYTGEVIEKSLAHEEKNKVKGAYNRAEYLEQRRGLLQWWADLLQDLE